MCRRWPSVVEPILSARTGDALRRDVLSDRDGGGNDGDAAAVDADPIQPARLYRAIRAAAPADAIFTMDAGTLCLQATDQMLYRQVPSLFTPLDFGLVGFSYACGLGAKLACPERTVISLIVLPLLPKGCVDSVITDPPYGIDYATNRVDRGVSASWRGKKIANDETTDARDAVLGWARRHRLPWACFGWSSIRCRSSIRR